MGMCLTLAFNKMFPECDAFSNLSDGKELAAAMDRLDTVCAEENIQALSHFAPDIEELAEKAGQGSELEESWFSIADGLRTVSKLLEVIESNKGWSKGVKPAHTKRIVESLKEVERILLIGKRYKARFYLLMY